MRINPDRQRRNRHPRVETLEPRQVLSADPLGGTLEHHPLEDDFALEQHTLPPPDFWLDPRDWQDIDQYFDNIEQLLSSAHTVTGWNQVQTDYGFRGGGQTVAVIDSGVAYDHWALGGGFGSDYRVVGGWDFSEENDANPYDDGPEGSHGTHVAGIIGSSHSTNSGVAPDVDLVALRVFNDAGDGYFSWVEKALQWVYTNRNAFANPITTVNLSIGSEWNSNSLPNWAMLEDEFEALKDVGIFIAVSAGNSFTEPEYDEQPGLSYPAASPHVVPVMSVDDNGSMSWYSQRHTSAIAAPGRGVISTVPDYAGNHNGTTDDFASKSGTSMAAPYVAGASVLIREAMEFVGYTGITQDTIYNHMLATADTFWDAITSTNYKRLNLGNAIDALIPDDDYGSTVATAYNMGAVSGTTQRSGMINTLTDKDYFRFTAGVTGTISFTADMSHGQTASWLASGDYTGWTSGPGGQTYNIEVVAGLSYTLGLSATGLSHFTLNVTAESSFDFSDWDNVNQKWVNNVNQTGEKLYRVQTSQAGYLTAEAFFTGSNVTIAWLNNAMQQVASGTSVTGGQRVQITATAGQQYCYLRVTGNNSDIDFRLTNLVSLTGTTVTVGGTAASDTFTFTAGTTQHTVTVNDVAYQFNTSSVNTINFDGSSGNDSITLTGTSDNETATIRAGSAELAGSGYAANAGSIENITIFGGGGNDSVTLYGSNGDDLYSVWSDRARMSGDGYFNEARFFNTTVAHAQGGFDRAHLYDTDGDDTYTAWSDRVLMSGSGFSHEAHGFDRTIAKSSAGNDTALFYDTAGNDVFSAWWDHAVMYGSGYFNDTAGFQSTIGYSSDGADAAFLYDSAGDDLYEAWSNKVVMSGNGFSNESHKFGQTFGFATVGNDRANLFDSAGDDTYTAWWDRVLMTGSGYANEARGFDRTMAEGSTGNDSATFYDTTGNDIFSAWWNHAVLYGNGFFNDTAGFKTTIAYASGGSDQAFLYDSAGDDNYTAWWNRALMQGNGFTNEAHNFDRTFAKVTTGNDAATFVDSTGNDIFSSWPDHAVMYGPGYFNDTWGFDRTLAYSLYGLDQAFFNDSPDDDLFEAWSNRAVLKGATYSNEARGFRRATAFASGGFDQAILYDSAASDLIHSLAWGAYMTDNAVYHNEVRDFDRIEGRRTIGGTDRAFVAAVDYVFALIGGWSP